MKIAVVHTISNEVLKNIFSRQFDAIIYFNIEQTVNYEKLVDKIKLIYAVDDAPASTTFCFNFVGKHLDIIKNKFPDFFTYKGYDLSVALHKDLFWAILKKNVLLYQVDKLSNGENEFEFFDSRSFAKQFLALANKLFFNDYRSYEFVLSNDFAALESKIAFRLNYIDTNEFYGDLFSKIGTEKVISFQTLVHDNSAKVHEKFSRIFHGNIKSKLGKKRNNKISLKTKLSMLFTVANRDFSNAFIQCYGRLCNHVEQYEVLAKYGVKKIVLNAGENEGEGSILCAVAKKYNCITYNYMNGTKTNEPQNGNTQFNYWFMPDVKTKELISALSSFSCGEQLPVTGHLLRENVLKHIYSGALDDYSEMLKDKKVISLFTSPVFYSERKEIFSFLIDYLNEKCDVIVLVRRHPSENSLILPEHDRIIGLPIHNGKSSQDSLFDLFLKSHITISFSSTISYQSSWFNLPTINYEHVAVSRLVYIDNEIVFHVNNLNLLKEYLDNFLYKGKVVPVNNEITDASDKIAEILLST